MSQEPGARPSKCDLPFTCDSLKSLGRSLVQRLRSPEDKYGTRPIGGEIWTTWKHCADGFGLHYFSIYWESLDFLEIADKLRRGRLSPNGPRRKYAAVMLYDDFLFHCLQSCIVFCQIREHAIRRSDSPVGYASPETASLAGPEKRRHADTPGQVLRACRSEWSRCFVKMLFQLEPQLHQLAERIGRFVCIEPDDLPGAYRILAYAQESVGQTVAALLQWEESLGYGAQPPYDGS